MSSLSGLTQGERKPSAGEAMFRTFADAMPTLGWIADATGYITWYNRRWHEYCGTTPEQMEGWEWQSVHDPEYLPAVLERWTKAIATGDRFEMTFPLRGADGVFRSFLTRAEPVRNEEGSITNWFGINTDVSAQLAAEQALREAHFQAESKRAEQAAILGQLAEGVIVADADGRITYVNPAAQRLHGVAVLDVEPEDYTETYHLFDLAGRPYPPRELPLARAVRGETVMDGRWRIRRPDGTEVLAAGAASPLVGPDGRQVGAVLTVRDETAREQAEREVRENAARLRALTDNLPGGIVYQVAMAADGSDRRFLYVSQSHEKLTGIPAEEVRADPTLPYQLIVPEDREHLAEAEAEAIRNRVPFDAEMRFRHRSGEIRWSRAISAPREQEDGSIIWDGIQIDITQQKEAEAALRASKDRLGAALGIAQLGTFEWDLATDEVLLDARSREIFGFKADGEIVAADVFGRIDPEDLERVLTEVERARAEASRLETEYRLVLPSGAGRTVASVSDAIKNTTGALKMAGVFSDITDRRRAEDRQRLLINELNHRVKNTLAIVQSLAQQTFKGQGPVAAEREAFNARLSALASAHNLLTRRTWEPVPLAQVMEVSVAATCGVERGRHSAKGPDVLLAPQTAVSVAMVLHELCTNAIKYGALSNGTGTVTAHWQVHAYEGGERLRLEWIERGGPVVEPPTRRGFGSRMIERGLAAELGARVELDFRREGLTCVIDAPLPVVKAA